MANGTLTAKDLARMCGTDGKRMRRFMRKHADAATQSGGEPIVPRVGQGNRYALTQKQANALVTLWKKAHAPQSEASEASES